ncbi:MAG TPA: dTDP-4-amino-4,6-dideoxygalactose transaminase [Myxococcaceae bacterium]|nr:dTDP-4-amino-4,6-dideoxygalactose transaminase [Myxococcaceae bacterium]
MSNNQLRIPFNQPVRLGDELEAIERAFRHGQTSGVGRLGARCEQLLESRFGHRTLLVSSCTHALEMAALLLDLAPGDEVLIPSFTFVSTANAFVLRGARPVFVDVDASGNLDVSSVAALRTPRTRAVCAVHYAGNSCDLRTLLDALPGIPLIEDAAQAIGASYLGRPLGTFGVAGAISFHETKNVGCGEGGALVIGRPELVERAEFLREKGTNRRQFSSGVTDKYTWVDLGSSYVLSELNAAYLEPQLLALDRIQARRSAIAGRYAGALAGPAERVGTRLLPQPPHNGTGNAHLFALVFQSGDQRTRYIAHMREHGILTPFHYVALHRSPMGSRFHDGRPLPQSERLTACLVRLPLFFNLTDAQVDEVVDRTLEFLRGL